MYRIDKYCSKYQVGTHIDIREIFWQLSRGKWGKYQMANSANIRWQIGQTSDGKWGDYSYDMHTFKAYKIKGGE